MDTKKFNSKEDRIKIEQGINETNNKDQDGRFHSRFVDNVNCKYSKQSK